MNCLPAALSSQQLYDRAVAPGALGAWECNLANATLAWTDGVYDLFGLPRGGTLYRAATLDLYHDHSRREMEQHRAVAIRTGKGFALDCQVRTAGDEDRWMRLVVGVGYQHGRPARIFGSKQDITAEKHMWDGLATVARNDPLTGLVTRRGFEDKVQAIVRDHLDGPGCFALVVFGVDQVSRDAADDCLRCLAIRLGRLFPDAVVMARSGEDEFALLLRITSGESNLLAMLEGSHKLLSRPMAHGSGTMEIRLSAGAAVLKQDRHRDHPAIFADAEAALHAARLAGRNCIRVFGGAVGARYPRLP